MRRTKNSFKPFFAAMSDSAVLKIGRSMRCFSRGTAPLKMRWQSREVNNLSTKQARLHNFTKALPSIESCDPHHDLKTLSREATTFRLEDPSSSFNCGTDTAGGDCSCGCTSSETAQPSEGNVDAMEESWRIGMEDIGQLDGLWQTGLPGLPLDMDWPQS